MTAAGRLLAAWDGWWRRRRSPPPRVPEDTVIYAIGDIHARHDLLAALEARIVADASTRTAGRRIIVCLGDYVSRGTDSRRVVEMMLAPPPAGFERVTLKGNHEDVLLRFLDGDLDAGRHWFDYDGMDTLEHYGVVIANREVRGDAALESLRRQFADALPPEHLAFFRGLVPSFRAGDYCFVHGGIRPGVPIDQQSAHDMMWIRRPFLDSDDDHGAVVVHGHTISPRPERRHNRIGIDTGAYRSGILTCVALAGAECRFIQTARTDGESVTSAATSDRSTP